MRRSSKSALFLLSTLALVLAFVWYKPDAVPSPSTSLSETPNNALDLDTDSIEMSVQSVSRAVVKKVLAIEQAEVRALTTLPPDERSSS